MQFIIGCDNAAVSLKELIAAHLLKKGFEVQDVGCFSSDDATAYPLVAQSVCERIIASGFQKRGVLICGTGIGMAMTANKFKGIRAAVCHDAYSAERSVLSNDCNVLCMGARVIGSELAKKIVDEWVGLQFDPNGRSGPKVREIMNIEGANLK
ncbi:MAG: ribose 5-phosphate isomerase B [Eubacteriales bacterium]